MQRWRFVSRSRGPSPGNRSDGSPKPGPVTRPRKRDRPQLDNLTAQSGRKKRAPDALEREADEAAKRLQTGDRARLPKGSQLPPSLIPPGVGRPLRPEARQLAEEGLGIDPNRVRVHDDRDARLAAAALGARAFADGSHIWLGAGASEHDRELMAHDSPTWPRANRACICAPPPGWSGVLGSRFSISTSRVNSSTTTWMTRARPLR